MYSVHDLKNIKLIFKNSIESCNNGCGRVIVQIEKPDRWGSICS